MLGLIALWFMRLPVVSRFLFRGDSGLFIICTLKAYALTIPVKLCTSLFYFHFFVPLYVSDTKIFSLLSVVYYFVIFKYSALLNENDVSVNVAVTQH